MVDLVQELEKEPINFLFLPLRKDANYAPKILEDINMEYNSSDEDLISHITKQTNESSNEVDKFLRIDRAPALCNILNW